MGRVPGHQGEDARRDGRHRGGGVRGGRPRPAGCGGRSGPRWLSTLPRRPAQARASCSSGRMPCWRSSPPASPCSRSASISRACGVPAARACRQSTSSPPWHRHGAAGRPGGWRWPRSRSSWSGCPSSACCRTCCPRRFPGQDGGRTGSGRYAAQSAGWPVVAAPHAGPRLGDPAAGARPAFVRSCAGSPRREPVRRWRRRRSTVPGSRRRMSIICIGYVVAKDVRTTSPSTRKLVTPGSSPRRRGVRHVQREPHGLELGHRWVPKLVKAHPNRGGSFGTTAFPNTSATQISADCCGSRSPDHPERHHGAPRGRCRGRASRWKRHPASTPRRSPAPRACGQPAPVGLLTDGAADGAGEVPGLDAGHPHGRGVVVPHQPLLGGIVRWRQSRPPRGGRRGRRS